MPQVNVENIRAVARRAVGSTRRNVARAAPFLFALGLAGAAQAADPFAITAMSDFVAPEAPGSHVQTYVIDVIPGGVIPLHHHLGTSIVLVLDGTLDVTHKTGGSASYGPGQTFIEPVGDVHTAAATADGPVKLVWTIVLPDGQPLMPTD